MSKEEEVLRCLDNTAPIERYDQLGLFYFATRFLPDIFVLPFGLLHYKVANLAFQMYDPAKESRMERQMYALVHRGAAKTTLMSFLLPLYCIFLKKAFQYGFKTKCRVYDDEWRTSRIIETNMAEDFILIISETASSAENFVTNIKSVIDERIELASYFGDKHADALKLDEEFVRGRGELIWRKNAFITSDKTIVYGIGSGQQVRGKNVLNTRPTLAICDDIYSERNTKTEEARKKIDTWFYSAMKNSVDIRKGKAIVLGTMVHPDTVFKDFTPHNDLWHGLRIPLIAEEELNKVIREHCQKKGMYLHIPGKYECQKIESTLKSLSWKENYSLHAILSLYKELYEKGKEAYFYQEYMNIVRKDAERSLDEKSFTEVDMRLYYNGTQYLIEVMEGGRLWTSVAETYIGVDLASSSSRSSDDTAIVIAGIGKFRRNIEGTDQKAYVTMPYIFEITGGKLSTFDISEQDSTTGFARKGWVNLLASYARAGNGLEMATIEVAGQYETVYNEAYGYFSRNKINLPLKAEKPPNDLKKEERIMNVLLPIKQRYRQIWINKACDKKDMFYSQLTYLGSDGMHDDYPDAAAYAFLYAREPRRDILDYAKTPKRYNHQSRYRVNSWETM